MHAHFHFFFFSLSHYGQNQGLSVFVKSASKSSEMPQQAAWNQLSHWSQPSQSDRLMPVLLKLGPFLVLQTAHILSSSSICVALWSPITNVPPVFMVGMSPAMFRSRACCSLVAALGVATPDVCPPVWLLLPPLVLYLLCLSKVGRLVPPRVARCYGIYGTS